MIASLHTRPKGHYTVESVRFEHRLISSGRGRTPEIAAIHADNAIKLDRCIVRDVDSGEEFEDRSRMTSAFVLGHRFAVTVDWRTCLRPIPDAS